MDCRMPWVFVRNAEGFDSGSCIPVRHALFLHPLHTCASVNSCFWAHLGTRAVTPGYSFRARQHGRAKSNLESLPTAAEALRGVSGRRERLSLQERADME